MEFSSHIQQAEGLAGYILIYPLGNNSKMEKAKLQAAWQCAAMCQVHQNEPNIIIHFRSERARATKPVHRFLAPRGFKVNTLLSDRNLCNRNAKPPQLQVHLRQSPVPLKSQIKQILKNKTPFISAMYRFITFFCVCAVSLFSVFPENRKLQSTCG